MTRLAARMQKLIGKLLPVTGSRTISMMAVAVIAHVVITPIDRILLISLETWR
jgi:hypothetical protein